MDDVTTKQEIKRYLESLIIGIQRGHEVAGVTIKVQTEAELAVRVGLKAQGATLLRILGYADNTVCDQVSVDMGSAPKFPDYVLGYPKGLIDLELKKPDENIDDLKWARQVLSYCIFKEIPLGVLFNGIALRVFINVRLFANNRDKNSPKYKLYFSEQPVARADASNISSMVDLFYALSSEQIDGTAIAFGRRLAKKRIAEIEGGEHQRRLCERLTFILSTNPPYIDEVLKSLSLSPELWTDFERQPDPEELRRAWNSRQLLINKKEHKIGLREVREKIVEVCEANGWSAIEKAKIKGLNYRLDGVLVKGYSPVTKGADVNSAVPTGLRIQRMNSSTARLIVDSLNLLL